MKTEKIVGPLFDNPESEERELTADEILNLDDEEILKVRVPEWGGVVRFKSMSGNDAIGMQRKLKDPAQRDTAIIQMFVMTAINKDGTQKFDEDAIKLLKRRRFSVFLMLQRELMKFNGYTTDDKKDGDGVKND